jgi:DNA-directed RNA polymerase subunit RPC12/RpoP
MARKSVELIASGYEWTCPKCSRLNNEIEVTETVTCPGCNTTFYEHSIE